MAKRDSHNFSYSFPAIRGVQAGREYYVTMCPLKLVPKLLHFEDADISPELKAQRTLNKSRVPQITNYIVTNPDNYIFSSLTVSIDGEIHFEPYNSDEIGRKLGILTISMETRLLLNDGQHRRAAIEQALEQVPALGKETISIVLFVDEGLEKSQQMFADLNRYAIRPTRSLGILYDHRDPLAKLVGRLIKNVSAFKGMTEIAKSTISNRSRKLFTLSGIYNATQKLLNYRNGKKLTAKDDKLAYEFWNEVAKNIPDWNDAIERRVTPSELRRDYIHSHGVVLQALAIAGSSLIIKYPSGWKKQLAKIKQMDWSRGNAKLWEGRALIGGRMNKAQTNVILTANAIKKVLGLNLDPSERKIEQQYIKGK